VAPPCRLCVCVCVCVLTHARNASIKLRASHWCAFVFIQGRSALLKEPILLSKKKKTHERSSSVSKSLKTMLGADCKLTHTRACACTSIASPLPPHLHHHCLLTCITITSSPASLLLRLAAACMLSSPPCPATLPALTPQQHAGPHTAAAARVPSSTPVSVCVCVCVCLSVSCVSVCVCFIIVYERACLSN
jgi:hypothetical protein